MASRRGYHAQNDEYGVILLGNSGVGKSFLANLILNEEVFEHANKASSVTHETRWSETVIGQGSYAVFDIPGLIEAKQSAIESNKKEIDRAFNTRPNSIVAFIFGAAQGGRVRDEDVVAFHAINKAYPLQSKSLLIIVNGVKQKRSSNYDPSVLISLRDYLSIDVNIKNLCFLEDINSDDEEEKDVLRERLLQFLSERVPKLHSKQQNIRLNADVIAQQKVEVRRLQAQFQAEQHKWHAEMAQYKAEMEKVHRDHDQQMRSLQLTMQRKEKEAAEERERDWQRHRQREREWEQERERDREQQRRRENERTEPKKKKDRRREHSLEQ